MISELFSVSTDELLKQGKPAETVKETAENRQDTASLEDIVKMNMANRQITTGSLTVVAGMIMFVIELMFLPVFGTLQKEHVNGQGFFSDFMKYAELQPMPIIFTLTGIVVLLGLGFMLTGLFYKKTRRK